MQGYNVLFPIGWDAFGLPTENYAIKNHIHPSIVTERNVKRFKEQLQALGMSFDWSREICTTDPEYYKWTQWIFLQLYKHGLAYKKEMSVNFCTSCKVVLANEEVVTGVCERCGSEGHPSGQSQWMSRYEYAQRLIDDLADSIYRPRKDEEINWIDVRGRRGQFSATTGVVITVYTTRPIHCSARTYMVLAPENGWWQWKPMLPIMPTLKHTSEAAKNRISTTEIARKTGVRLEGVGR